MAAPHEPLDDPRLTQGGPGHLTMTMLSAPAAYSRTLAHYLDEIENEFRKEESAGLFYFRSLLAVAIIAIDSYSEIQVNECYEPCTLPDSPSCYA
jgi:hypothetical protein